jgi:hypothetical protein
MDRTALSDFGSASFPVLPFFCRRTYSVAAVRSPFQTTSLRCSPSTSPRRS